MTLPVNFIEELRATLDAGRLADSPETRCAYSYDATDTPYLPDLVVFPESEAEVARTLELCNRYRVPITPRGAGVGFSGGSLPVQAGVVLVLTRLNRILEIDPDNLVAVVEPGVITQDLQDAVKRHGLYYPPDPASSQTSTIGGNVAECAGGLSAVKYGVTKHYVLGVRFVLPDGTIHEMGGKTVKNVAGYDLIGLLVGSEGTLAVMTRFTLKLLPQPESRRTLLVAFQSIVDSGAAVSAIIRARIVPTALELMDRNSIEAVDRFLGFGFTRTIQALLLVEIDGKQGDVDRGVESLREMIPRLRGEIVREAAEGREREAIWEVRRSISPAIAMIRNMKINEDIVVPRSKIPDILSVIQSISVRLDLIIVCFGHAGDGNIHVNIMVDRNAPDELARAGRAVEEILQSTVAMGGAISGEHGIGLVKKTFLHLNLTPEVMALSRRIKHAFDPNGILNPGKIFPD